ncbi:MAG TPA: lytic transglycosylase domain-containing protein, partial [Paracoccaceae bacterium]
GGDGHWFATREEALAHAAVALDAGRRNLDLGCFQLNHRWHAGGFPSLEAMLDPAANALYAARFLQRLHETHGDWSRAAGAYHSNTPEFAERYRTRFDSLLAGLDGRTLAQPRAVAALAPRRNSFPLLRAGAAGSGGSLVPLPDSGRRLIGGQP